MGRVSHTVIGEVWEGMTTVAGGGMIFTMGIIYNTATCTHLHCCSQS